MAQVFESALNTWLAAALSERGLEARPESMQGGGKHIDVAVRLDQVIIP